MVSQASEFCIIEWPSLPCADALKSSDAGSVLGAQKDDLLLARGGPLELPDVDHASFVSINMADFSFECCLLLMQVDSAAMDSWLKLDESIAFFLSPTAGLINFDLDLDLTDLDGAGSLVLADIAVHSFGSLCPTWFNPLSCFCLLGNMTAVNTTKSDF